MPQTVSIHTTSEKLITQLRLNDVPIAYDFTGRGIDVDDQANEWVRKGPNSLDLTLDWPGHVPFQPGMARASVEVRLLSAGVSASGVPPLVSLKWPLRMPEAYPQRLIGEFKQPDFPNLQLWQECEPISEITPPDRVAIGTVLRKLHAAYNGGDATQVIELLAFRLDDVALAFGDNPAKLQSDTRETIQEMAATAGWGLLDLVVNNLEFEIVGEKHVAWVTGPAKSEALASKRMKTFQWAMHVYFGRVGGVWKIVR
jgi:hypothetical protein